MVVGSSSVVRGTTLVVLAAAFPACSDSDDPPVAPARSVTVSVDPTTTVAEVDERFLSDRANLYVFPNASAAACP